MYQAEKFIMRRMNMFSSAELVAYGDPIMRSHRDTTPWYI